MRAYSSLVWEQWRQTGLLVLAALFSVLMLQVLDQEQVAKLLPELGLGNTGSVAESLAWFFAGIAVLLLFVHEDTRGLRLDFPRRMLTTPVSTVALVSIPFLYRLVLISAVGIAVAYRVHLAFTDSVGVLMASVAAAQAVSCTATAYGNRRAAFFGVVIGVLFVACIFTIREATAPLIFLAAVALGWATSLQAISAARGRDLFDFSRAGIRDAFCPQVKATRLNQIRSQVWFEWQRVNRWILLSAGIVIAVSATIDDDFSFLLLFMICWAGGFLLMRMQGSSESLCGRLPWSTARLAEAKLIAGALTVAGILLMVAVWAFFSAERHTIGFVNETGMQFLGLPSNGNPFANNAFAHRIPQLSPWQAFGLDIYSPGSLLYLLEFGMILFATLMAGRLLLLGLGAVAAISYLAILPILYLPEGHKALPLTVALGAIAALIAAIALRQITNHSKQRIWRESLGWFALVVVSVSLNHDLGLLISCACMLLCLELLVLFGQACISHRLLPSTKVFATIIGVAAFAVAIASLHFPAAHDDIGSEAVLDLEIAAILLGCLPLFAVPLSIHRQRHT